MMRRTLSPLGAFPETTLWRLHTTAQVEPWLVAARTELGINKLPREREDTYADICSSTLPFVSTPSAATINAAVTKQLAPSANTPI